MATPRQPLVVGVLGETRERLREAIGECPVELCALPADDGILFRDELLNRSDMIVMRLADGLNSWALLTGALHDLIAGRLLSVYVIAEDISAVESFLRATSAWGEDSAAVQSFRDAGRLRIVTAEDFGPSDLRAQLETVLSRRWAPAL